MELPATLRQAVDEALDGVALSDVARAADILSRRYRAEVRDGRPHLADDMAARAYLATRLPATYAAIRASLTAVAEMRPDFLPHTFLDAGAGAGSALWAASDCWPSLTDALLIEASPAIRRFGERLTAALPLRLAWRSDDLSRILDLPGRHDLVTLAYVLDELAPEVRGPVVDRLWALTTSILVILEPGTPAGWSRVLEARTRLIAAGAHLVAPCPPAPACPLRPPDWCHFSRRVARSRLHRRAKGADIPWEDEKFIYVAAARGAGAEPDARVIAPPRRGSGRVTLKLCMRSGVCEQRMVTRRDDAAFRIARRLDWGDAISTM